MADPLPPACIPSAGVLPPARRRPCRASLQDEYPSASTSSARSPADALVSAETRASEEAQPDVQSPPLAGAPPDLPSSPALPQEPSPRPARRWAWALLLVLVSAVLGTYLAEPPRPTMPADASNDLLLLLGAEPEASVRAFDRADAASAFVRAETGARVSVPRLDGFALTGAGVADVGVPVPLYRLSDGETDLSVYAVTYAHLDHIEDDVRLARPVRNRVASAEPLVQPLGSTTALVWRDRATLFFAFTADPPASLLDALR